MEQHAVSFKPSSDNAIGLAEGIVDIIEFKGEIVALATPSPNQ